MKFVSVLSVMASAFANGATTINWSNDSDSSMLRDLNGAPLSSGNPLVEYDGTIVTLGYYSQSTTSDPFAGDWIILDFSTKTIGDKSTLILGDGVFSYSTLFSITSLSPGKPLAIRFYDSDSIAGSSHFNAVSSMTWGWQDNSEINLSLSNSTLVWQGGAGSAFRTTISIPEPRAWITSTGLLFLAIPGRKRDSPLRDDCS